MTFELYKKGSNTGGLLDNQVSIAKTVISFARNITETFLKDRYIEVYLDRDNYRVGFKSTKSNITGFKLQFKDEQKSGVLASPSISRVLPVGVYEAKLEDGFWVIFVPEIATKK